MSVLTVPNLVTRSGKGAALTAAEHDANLTTLRNFCNSLAALMGVSLNTDGSLKDGSVGLGDIADRTVGQKQLAATALAPLLDSSTAPNVFVITPDPALAQYEDGQVFLIRSNNTVTSSCQVNVNGLGLKPLSKRGGLDVEADDILRHQIFMVAYYGGEFELVAVSGAGSGSGESSGFSGFSTYTPTNTALPTGGLPAVVDTFVHGLNTSPNFITARLICVAVDAATGYAGGEELNLGVITDASGNPAFAIKSTADNIVVTMLAAPYAPHATTGVSTAITLASWKLKLEADAVVSSPVPTFPALTYSVKQPVGVMANGNDLFYVAYSDGNALTARINMVNNNMTRVTPSGTNPNHLNLNPAPFRRADGLDYFVFTSNLGVYSMPMAAPYQPVFVTASNVANYKPCWITESGGTIQQVLAGGYSEAITGVTLRANAAYNHGGTIGNIAAGAVGASFDFRSATILNASGAGGNDEFRAMTRASDTIVMMQYNRITKRIYVITRQTLALHIFKIVGDTSGYSITDSLLEFWLDASRYAKLQYIKTIALAGSGDYSAGALNAEQYGVDVNLDTGAERAIVFCRQGNAAYSGSLTRIPWKE